MQEVCVRAIPRLGELDESRSVRAWLLTVLHNLFVDDVRRAVGGPFTGQSDSEFTETACPEPDPEQSASNLECEERLHAAWARLSLADQALLALRAEEYSASEIAEITSIPISALYARLYRARSNLARQLYGRRSTETDQRMEIAK